MGFAGLILCPAAILFSVIAAIRKRGNSNILVVISFICCLLPIIFSIYDILDRINKNDIDGIIDIYPSMNATYLVVFGIVTAFNLYWALKKGQRPKKGARNEQ